MKPSLLWAALAFVLGVAGAAGAALLVVDLIDEFDKPDALFVTPGSTVVEIDGGRKRTIYQQLSGAEQPAIVSEVSASRLDCRVTGPREEPIRVTRNDSYTTTSGEDEYASKLDFDPPRAGSYRVRCSSDPGRVALAVGKKFRPLRFTSRLLGAIASFLGGALVAGGGIGAVLIMRDRDRRRREPPSPA